MGIDIEQGIVLEPPVLAALGRFLTQQGFRCPAA